VLPSTHGLRADKFAHPTGIEPATSCSPGQGFDRRPHPEAGHAWLATLQSPNWYPNGTSTRPRTTKTPLHAGLSRNRGARIRTGDLTDPNGARYQAAPRPDAFPVSHTSPLIPSLTPPSPPATHPPPPLSLTPRRLHPARLHPARHQPCPPSTPPSLPAKPQPRQAPALSSHRAIPRPRYRPLPNARPAPRHHPGAE
jgi:hypothetical protein